MIGIDFMFQGEYLSSHVFNDITFANRGTNWFYETTSSPIYYVFTKRSNEILEREW